MAWVKTFDEKEAGRRLAEMYARIQRLVEQNANKR